MMSMQRGVQSGALYLRNYLLACSRACWGAHAARESASACVVARCGETEDSIAAKGRV